MKKILMIMMLASSVLAGEKLYYATTNEVDLIMSVGYLNSSAFLPASGTKNGEEVPNQTTSWYSFPQDTNGVAYVEKIGDYFVCPKIPDKRLDKLGVPEANRTNFLNAFSLVIIDKDGAIYVPDDEEGE